MTTVIEAFNWLNETLSEIFKEGQPSHIYKNSLPIDFAMLNVLVRKDDFLGEKTISFYAVQPYAEMPQLFFTASGATAVENLHTAWLNFIRV